MKVESQRITEVQALNHRPVQPVAAAQTCPTRRARTMRPAGSRRLIGAPLRLPCPSPLVNRPLGPRPRKFSSFWYRSSSWVPCLRGPRCEAVPAVPRGEAKGQPHPAQNARKKGRRPPIRCKRAALARDITRLRPGRGSARAPRHAAGAPWRESDRLHFSCSISSVRTSAQAPAASFRTRSRPLDIRSS